jgi:two-component system sensor histidine kinase UhpB
LLILVFVTIGATFSVAVNYTLVALALGPLYAVFEQAETAAAGEGAGFPAAVAGAGPDVSALSEAVATLVRQLETRNRELRALSRRALNAQEAERKRIALSLHDDTNQNLSSLIVQLERLEHRPPETGTALQERLHACGELARDTVKELRKIIYDLRPSVLDDLGLVPAIRSYAKKSVGKTDLRLTLNLPEREPFLSTEQAVALFRICQEAIHNVVRHAQATEITITLQLRAHRICLLIEDDGQGFDPDAVAREAVGQEQLGLLGMAERAELIQATFAVNSSPGVGTCVQVCVPLATGEATRGPQSLFGASSPLRR